MATTLIFDITNLTSDINTGVVSSVEFSVKAKSDDGFLTRGFGDVINLSPPGEKFVDFDILTHDDVVNWIQNQIHSDKLNHLQELLEAELEELKNPTTKTTLPWAVVD